MPRLSSGRHVCLTTDHLLAALTRGSNEMKFMAVVSYRLTVTNPEALRKHLRIGYLEGPPPSPAFLSPYTVQDVLEGRSDWCGQDVADFREWFETHPAVGPWLEMQFDLINEAIRNDPLFESELFTGD